MIKNLVEASRSVRTFRPNTEISEDALLALIDIARKCPAAMNLQTLKYKLVTKKEERDALLGITRWATSLKVKLPPKDHEPAAYIVICHDKSIAEERPIFMIDVGIVSQTMLLAAKEIGLGGCLIGSASGEAIKSTLSLPENISPKLILALGIPAENIVLEDAEDGCVTYYRDEDNTHHVPKRKLEDIII